VITTRFTKFAAASVATDAISLGALATAATASAETYQGGVICGANGGHATLHWQGAHPGSVNVHWHLASPAGAGGGPRQ
jgi:hypothetical protein